MVKLEPVLELELELEVQDQRPFHTHDLLMLNLALVKVFVVRFDLPLYKKSIHQSMAMDLYS